MTTEMLIPAKYKGDIDQLRYGHHGWHGFRHRRDLGSDARVYPRAGDRRAHGRHHPDDVMNALFEKSLTEYADQAAAAEADEEARR